MSSVVESLPITGVARYKAKVWSTSWQEREKFSSACWGVVAVVVSEDSHEVACFRTVLVVTGVVALNNIKFRPASY